MFDFGALPPEINSARMYAGPGSGPMMAAASAWDAVAGQLDLYASGFDSVISTLQGQSWSGGASIAMATAAAPYVVWATATSAQAEQAANQARAAAGAYEAAFAATVPPAVVAANRIQLAMLVATNFFGQNTPTIAATEAAYAEMWAQDAAAMYGYAASSSAAATLTPFSEPPQTTNAPGQSGQAAAVAQAAGNSTAGQAQSTLSGSTSSGTSPLVTAVSEINTLNGPLLLGQTTAYSVFQAGNFVTGAQLAAQQAAKAAAKSAAQAATAEAVTPEAASGRSVVFASANNAEQVGRLSVPQAWTGTSASPAVEPVVPPEPGFRALPTWATHPSATTPGGVPALGPMTNAAGRRGGNAVFRKWDRRFRMPRPAVGG